MSKSALLSRKKNLYSRQRAQTSHKSALYFHPAFPQKCFLVLGKSCALFAIHFLKEVRKSHLGCMCPMFPQKSPILAQKSTVFLQKSPVLFCHSLRERGRQISPGVYVCQRALFSRKRPLFLRKRALDSRRRALYSRERTIYFHWGVCVSTSPIFTQKSPLLAQRSAGFFPTKEPFIDAKELDISA